MTWNFNPQSINTHDSNNLMRKPRKLPYNMKGIYKSVNALKNLKKKPEVMTYELQRDSKTIISIYLTMYICMFWEMKNSFNNI